jgi:hypothetical protein
MAAAVHNSLRWRLAFGSARHNARDGLTAVPTINAKVAIRCENDRIRKRFGHTNQARVGEAHRYVCILLHEGEDFLHFGTQVKGRHDRAATEKPGEALEAACADKVVGLRQYRIATFPRWRKAPPFGNSPVVIAVPVAEQRNQEAGVN